MIIIDFLGMKCSICQKPFNQGEDVVVCPDCGTPMHRGCYNSEGACPNKDKHSSDFVFEDFENISKLAMGKTDEVKLDKQTDVATSICLFCGNSNPEQAVFCNQCGSPLVNRKKSPSSDPNTAPRMSDYFDPLAGIPAEAKFEDDVTAADLACFVKVNTPYYLAAFSRMKNNVNKFNFSAALFSGGWFLYRKQYKVGGLVLALNVLLYVIRLCTANFLSYPILKEALESMDLTVNDFYNFTTEQYMILGKYMTEQPFLQQFLFFLPSIILCLQIVIMVLFGIFANKMYYKHCIYKIKKVKGEAVKDNLSNKSVAMLLNNCGGVNWGIAFVFAVLYIAVLFLL